MTEVQERCTSSLETIPHFLRLSDRIGTAGQPSAEQFAAIQEAGYEVVVNLRPPADTLPNERDLVESSGMAYVSIPVIWDAPTVEDVEQFFATMQANEDKRVFVHCAMNMRVSAFMYLYRVVKAEGRARSGCSRPASNMGAEPDVAAVNRAGVGAKQPFCSVSA